MAKPAKKVKQTTVTTVEGDGTAGDEIVLGGEGEAPPVDAMAELLGIESDGISYKVFQRGEKPGDKPLLYCASYTKESLSLEAIRDSFGGGTYRIVATDAHNKFVKQYTVSIFGFAKPTAATPAPATASSDSNMFSVLMQLIRSQGETITAAISSTKAPAGPTAMELVTLIKALQPADKTDPIELLLKGLTLGKEMGGEGGGSDLLSIAGKGIDAVKTLAAAQAAKAPAQPKAPPAIAIAPPTGASTADTVRAQEAPQPKTKEEIDAMITQKKLLWLQALTGDLIKRAERGKNAELYAEVFLDNLPSFVSHEEIKARFADAGAVAQLSMINPKVAEYAPWFEEFRRHVLEMIEQDEAPDDGEVFNPDMPRANGGGELEL